MSPLAVPETYRATILLCDFVQVCENKLFINGGGWSLIGPGPAVFGLAVKIDVPWHETNKRIAFALKLLDEDSNEVNAPRDSGEPVPVAFQGSFEVGRPPGLKPGTSLDVPLGFNIGPLALASDSRFVWELWINGESRDDWRLPFTTRPGSA